MARVVSIEEGASGVAKASTAEGSLFVFRTRYLAPAYAYCGLNKDAVLAAGDEIHTELFEFLSLVMIAEHRAVGLVARAEQYRRGLEHKLLARKQPGCELPPQAVVAVLDWLEGEGLLSDQRYAETWMRQRIRRHPEGPRSLAAALAVRGVDRHAAQVALAALFQGSQRIELLANVAAMIRKRHEDTSAQRVALLELGWRPTEIAEYLMSCSSDA
jgi:regulatory protein